MSNLKFPRRTISFLMALLVTALSWGQVHISTQAHQSTVNQVTMSLDGAFFSSGEDGYIIRWTQDGLGEHYQISDIDVPLFAVHPNGEDIAVYETDGFSIHRLSVWHWPSLKRKFVKVFSSGITTLEFSAKGTLLAVGTASVNGLVFLNPDSGKAIPKLKEATGIVSMFQGSASEKSAVVYSPTGFLTYYDMTKGERKERFSTEAQLEQVRMSSNNMVCVGVKANHIYVINALSGKTISTIPAPSPLILEDYLNTALHYLEYDGKNYLMKSVEINVIENELTVSPPVVMQSFQNMGRIIECGFYRQEGLVLGAKDGNLFSLAPEGGLSAITDSTYSKVYDLAAIGQSFYFLTKDTIFRSSYERGPMDMDVVGEHNGFTDIIAYNNEIILWSRGTKKSVVRLNLETSSQTPLFTPRNYLETMRLFDNKLVYIEGNTTVKVYDMESGYNSELYKGTGIQDIVLYNNSALYVAKSTSSEPRSPLIKIDTETKETVIMKVDGSVAFSLDFDKLKDARTLYGIQITSQGGKNYTSVFVFYPERNTSSAIMKIQEEDIDAFLSVYDTTIYTNIGKNQIRSYDTRIRREVQLNRSASLPLKLVRSENEIAVLNRDGSISWYNDGSGQVIADWYMTKNKQWVEF